MSIPTLDRSQSPSASESPKNSDYAVVLAGHGSRDTDGVREFEALVEAVKQRAPGRIVTHGFLEFSVPTIDEAARVAIEQGAKAVSVVPAILLAAAHGKNDMPSEVQALRLQFPKHQFHFGAPTNLHPVMLDICRERIVQAEAASPRTVARGDTLLVVVGRGTTDPDANSEVSKLARILEEGLGFGGSYVCYSGTAKPLVADGLRYAARLGFARIIVLPFFLFTGILVKRIYAATEEAALRFPGVEFLKCDYLGLHARVADLILSRAAEAVEGKAQMNCSLCKYRVQMVGYEQEVGTPQAGHHFHVRGGGPGANEHPVKISALGSGVIGGHTPPQSDEESPHSKGSAKPVNEWNQFASEFLHESNGTEAPTHHEAPLHPGGMAANSRGSSQAIPPVTDRIEDAPRRGASELTSPLSPVQNGTSLHLSPTPSPPAAQAPLAPYEPHPIERESFQIIDSLRDWSTFAPLHRAVLQRLVHTTGDVAVIDEVFISHGALEAAMKALAQRVTIVTDVTMVQSGLRRTILEQLGLSTWCSVHDSETRLLAETAGITRSAAGIRRAWQKFGNDVILAIGDAPTAVEEAVRLVNQNTWRPHLIIGLPVGFVGTRESKETLRKCLRVPRITNSGTRGGSPWAATVVNALLIQLLNVNARG
jgi:precorrin isomerase/sirohydrochlorin ferrochelatase